MIVCDSPSFVFLSVPRTGSRSICEAMLRTFPAARRVGMQHDMEVPEEFRDRLTFCGIRNPYERAYSLWCYYQQHARSAWHGRPFPDLVDRIAAGDPMFRPITELTADSDVDLFLPFEELNNWQQMRMLAGQYRVDPIPLLRTMVLPHVGGDAGGRAYFHVYTAETARKIHYHSAGDFERFGYDRDSWRHNFWAKAGR